MKVVYTPRLPKGARERIAGRFSDVELVELSHDDPGFSQELCDAGVLAGWAPPLLLSSCKSLRWFQLGSAGADGFVGSVPETVCLTNASGVFDVAMAEHAFALMLALARGVDSMVRAQAEARWEKGVRRGELFAAQLTIVGLGRVGTAIAQRAKAFGMRVVGVKRRPSQPPACVDRLITLDELDKVLPSTDHLMLVLPSSPQTRHILDARRLELLPRHACLYNLGRGTAVDEAALAKVLSESKLAGAGLDVFEREPLPPESPLWGLQNVIVSPHLGGRTSRYPELFFELFFENLTRFLAGEPLFNQVDRAFGY
jgi:D-2-hydroxyacid dehydrogenase (NADP+)